MSEHSAFPWEVQPLWKEKKAALNIGTAFLNVMQITYYFVGVLSIQTIPMEARHIMPAIMNDVE